MYRSIEYRVLVIFGVAVYLFQNKILQGGKLWLFQNSVADALEISRIVTVLDVANIVLFS